MTRLGVDADELGSVAGVACLKLGGILERVCGNHAVVMIGCGDKCSGIGCAVVLDVVQGRVGEQIACHFGRIGACSVIGSPVPTDGEQVIAHHVHNAYTGNGHLEQVGAKVHCSAHEQSAVGAALDCEVVGRCPAFLDHVLGVDAAVFKPEQTLSREAGVERHVEASVTVEVDGVLAVAFKTFLVGDEHRYLGSVGRGVEHLLGHVVVHVKSGDFNCLVGLRLA